MNAKKLTIGEDYPEKLNVVVEIPAGGHNKYEYDEELDIIKLDRVLHSPFFYPVDYGFIPGTLAGDGDHLDALVVTDSPTFPGCMVEVRPLGLFKMEDDKGIDEKVLAVPVKNPHFNNVKTMEDLPQNILDGISHFFEQYKKLEKKEVAIKGWGSLQEALDLIKKYSEDYKNKA